MHAYVVGNVTIDETIIVDELPTAGASILGVSGTRDMGGKGANQAVVMARCGLPTTLITALGHDARAAEIRQYLQPEPVVSALIECTEAASDASFILRLPGGENAIVTSTESAQSLRLSDVAPLLVAAQPGDLLVLQGNLSEQASRDILRHGKALGMVTALNPSPLRPYFSDVWSLVDIAFLNQGEAQALTGAGREAAAARLLEKGVREVVVTLGSEGALLANQHETIFVPAKRCDVVDTTGAGDVFMAVALASAARRVQPMDRRSLEHASQAAAMAVAKAGTYRSFPTAAMLAAIFGLDAAAPALERL